MAKPRDLDEQYEQQESEAIHWYAEGYQKKRIQSLMNVSKSTMTRIFQRIRTKRNKDNVHDAIIDAFEEGDIW